MSLKQWMETVEYRITEGSEYCWGCYGPDAYSLDSWNGIQDGSSFSIIFDKRNQTVYQMDAHDYANERSYRWFNPDFKLAHDREACEREIDDRVAYDGVNYVDLEVLEDFFEKMAAIFNGEDYDTRVEVPLTLEKDKMYQLMMLAHEHDMTLNEFVEFVLKQEIERIQNEEGLLSEGRP